MGIDYGSLFSGLAGQATAPGISSGGSKPASGYDWKSLIPSLAGVGGSLLGSSIANGQQKGLNQQQIDAQKQMQAASLGQNQQQFDTNMAFKQGEQARRNQIAGAASPGLLHDLGYRDPDQIAKLQQQFSQQPQGQAQPGSAGAGGGPQIPYSPAATQGSSLAKGIGMAGSLGGAGASIAGALGVSALGGPVGLGIEAAGALGSLVASKIGQGRRAANSFVQSVENPFGQQDLPQVQQLMQSGQTDAAKQLLTNAHRAYTQAVNEEMAKGGNEAKVAQQSMQNPTLQKTVQSLAQQLGVQL